jgi:hypothetical protein
VTVVSTVTTVLGVEWGVLPPAPKKIPTTAPTANTIAQPTIPRMLRRSTLRAG